MSDSEARERARQEFETWANSVDYVELFDAWLAGRRSLEQERDELLRLLRTAFNEFAVDRPAKRWTYAEYSDWRKQTEVAVNKGDS